MDGECEATEINSSCDIQNQDEAVGTSRYGMSVGRFISSGLQAELRSAAFRADAQILLTVSSGPFMHDYHITIKGTVKQRSAFEFNYNVILRNRGFQPSYAYRLN